MRSRASYPVHVSAGKVGPHGAIGESIQVDVPPSAAAQRRSMDRVTSAAFRTGEALFVTVAIFLLTGAVIPLLLLESGIESTLDAGSASLRLVFMWIYGVTAFLALLRWKRAVWAVIRDPLTLLVIGFAALSTAWSLEPSLTLQRSVALILTTGFGWYMAVRYAPIDLLRTMVAALGIVLVMSACFGIWLPDLGISRGDTFGSWQGVFTHKNTLGKYAALGALLAVLHLRSERKWSWMSFLVLAFAVPLLILSRSQTALIAVVTLFTLLPLTGVLRWRLATGAPIISGTIFVAGIVIMLIVNNLEPALAAIGRDTTFTGRTALWAAVIESALARPMFGVGYSAFWVPGSPEADWVRRTAGWGADASHNGFLDVWLELGAIGVTLVVLSFVAATKAALRLLRSTRAPEAAWPILCLAFIALTNMSEGGILRQNNFIWVLFVMSAATAYRYTRGLSDELASTENAAS